jgi:exosortase/archaeosortase family protein
MAFVAPGPSSDVKGAAPHPDTRVRSRDIPLSRGQFFAAVVAIGFANGSSEKVAKEVTDLGWSGAILNTFGISVIVWGALLAVMVLLVRAAPDPVRRADIVAAVAAAGAFLIPIPDLSWLAIAGLAVHLLWSTSGRARRAAVILLALTIPMFWARMLMAALGNLIIEVDATFVAWVVGTQRNGNLVPFADDSGSLWIAPGCSSFTNISLAVLCTVTFVQVLDRRWSPSVVLWGLAACLAVIAVNTVRIGLIGLYPPGYELFHGPVGASVASWITIAAIVVLCHYGIGRNAPTAG